MYMIKPIEKLYPINSQLPRRKEKELKPLGKSFKAIFEEVKRNAIAQSKSPL